MKLRPAILLLLLCAILQHTAYGQKVDETQTTRVLFIFDASNSMNAKWQSDSRIKIARQLLKDAVGELNDKPNVQMALRVYGHQVPISKGEQDCEDTKLEVSFRANNGGLIQRTLDKVVPQGTTPIARSLEKSGDDFPPCSNCRNVIILITDGIEACDGDPCAVSRALQKNGIILKPFVIGVGLDEDFRATFSCVGNYFDASTEDSFRNILDIVVTQALNNTTVQVNLLDDFEKPMETNLTVNFFDENTDALTYGFVHALNHRGNPDTISLDPIITYRMEVHTIPMVVKHGINVLPGRHNIIAVDAGQGKLEVKVPGRQGGNAEVILRKQGELKTLHVQKVNYTETIRTGLYDIEILTLPRTLIDNVEITQNKTTTVTIPEPGVLNVAFTSPGHGSIAKVEGSNLRWVANINKELNQQYQLQPGEYKITYRSQNSKEVIYTIERTFKINSGSATNLKL